MRRTVLGWVVMMLVGCGAAAAPSRPSAPRPTAAPSATGVEQQRSRFLAGHQAAESGRYAEATALLEPLCPAYPQLGDYCLRDLAESRAALGDQQAAEVLWTRLNVEYPQSLHAGRAQLERARLRRQAGDSTAARALLETARLSDDDAVALHALLELADLEIAADNVAAADTDLAMARARAPGTPLGLEAKRQQESLRRVHPELAPRGPAAVTELRLLLKEGDFAGARVLADQLVAASASAAERAEMLRLRADAELGGGDVERCLATLQEVARVAPDPAVAAEAQYRYATLLWNKDRNDEARVAFGEFTVRFPGDARMPDVLYALARIAQGNGQDEDAIALYTQLADRYPASTVAHDARWRIGWIRYRAGRFGEAAAAFARASDPANPIASADATYWQARALERSGDRAGAQRLYVTITTTAPGTYYAELAEQRLGSAATAPPRVAASPAPRIGTPPPGGDPFHWTRAAELQAIGLEPLARAEVRAFERASPDGADTSAVIVAYQATGGYRDAIRLGSARGLTDPAIFFPLAFWPQVSATAKREGVDPFLVLALMRQESMFDPSARSSADARGLMQLLPSTADQVARRTGRPPPSGNLYDPDTNIALGVAHLRELFDGYGGDRIKVLAAYNGGPNAVARWQQRFGSLEPDEFVESITYRETRDYVKRVLGNYRRYQQAYARG